jgi:molybdopterin converting factor small subunit
MTIQLVAYGIAKDILKARTMAWAIQRGYSIASLKKDLVQRYPTFGSLTKLSFAVGEEYREDDFMLIDGAEVVIIPPVSGG